MIRKENHLYTVNKWNKNLFVWGGEAKPIQGIGLSAHSSLNTNPTSAYRFLNDMPVDGLLTQTRMDDKLANSMASMSQSLPETVVTGGDTVGLQGNSSNNSSSNWKSTAKGIAGQAIAAIPDDVLQIMDPTSYLAGGKESKLGNGMQQMGKDLFKAGASSGNPWVMLAGAGSQVLGSLTNAAFGYKLDNAESAKSHLNNLRNINVTANTTEGLAKQMATADLGTSHVVGHNGWFTNKGTKKAASLNNAQQQAKSFAVNSFANAARNINHNQKAQMLQNYAAYGGPIDGAIGYGFMSDYLDMKNKQADKYNKITSMPNSFSATPPAGTLFATGGGIEGLMQAHGSNWNGGVSQINAGGSHEQNPNQGIQFGTDSQGVPNMVEEGEVVWNDFVFSDRIKMPQSLKKQFGIRGKKELTFADAAKKLQNESKERPNDPISLAGLNASLERLADAQEELKQETEAKKAQEEFAKLPPEQQQAIMQEMAAQEQQAQQQAMQEEQMQQQAAQEQQMAQGQQEQMAQEGQQMSPEEQAAYEQQQAAQQQAMMQQEAAGQQAAIAQGMQEPNVSAYGGPINKFDGGGSLSDILATYFPGMTVDEVLGLIYDNNSSAKVAGRTDTEGPLSREDYIKNHLNDLNPQTVLEEDAIANYKNYLLNAWYAQHPEAKNSNAQFGFTPVETWDPSTFTITAKAQKGKSNPPNKDKYLALTENDFVNDIAYKELSKEQKKLKGQKLAEALEGTQAYKKFRDYLKGNEEAALAWLGMLAKQGSDYANNRVELDQSTGKYKFRNGYTFEKDFEKMLNNISYDATKNSNALSVGHFTFAPETKWVNRAYLKNADGSYSLLTSAPTDMDKYELINANPYQSSANGLNYKDSYYRLKTTDPKKAKTDEAGNGTDAAAKSPKLKPVLKNENLKYAGIAGPLVGLGMMAAEVGKPDYSEYEKALSMSKAAPVMADYKPIGDYLTYMPIDTDYEINKLKSSTAGGRNAILNSGSTPSRMAGLVALNYQEGDKIGGLYRDADKYNFEKQKTVAEFNRGTNQYNATAYNDAEKQWAKDYNDMLARAATMQGTYADKKMEGDAGWYNSYYGNVAQATKAATELGLHNAKDNLIARAMAQGLTGHVNPGNYVDSMYVDFEDDEKRKKNNGTLKGRGIGYA